MRRYAGRSQPADSCVVGPGKRDLRRCLRCKSLGWTVCRGVVLLSRSFAFLFGVNDRLNAAPQYTERFAMGRSVMRLNAVCVWVLTIMSAGARADDAAIQRQLKALLSSLPHSSTIATACVLDLERGQVVFSFGADRPMVPASTMKVIAMAAAIHELGGGFQFETVLATDNHDLFVIGDGDPAFGDGRLHRARGEAITDDFARWVNALRVSGIESIPGDLVIDETIFDNQLIHPSWEESDLDNWYAAPVGGLNFNDNCVDVTIKPAAAGAPVLFDVVPKTSVVEIINKAKTGSSKKAPVLHHLHDSFTYRIGGRCSKKWPFGSVSFPDPGLLFGDSLRTFLRSMEFRIAGDLRRQRVRLADGSLPESLHVVATRVTPLADVLGRAGRDSQNMFAESLLKRAGYEWSKRRGEQAAVGSWANGAGAVGDMFDSAGISSGGLVVADGSGLSRDNRCTARQLTLLLGWMARQGDGELFKDSLSVAGVNGSLRKRLKELGGRVLVKSGTMRGIRALCGYIDANKSEGFAFAIMFNGYKGPSTPYREIQDRFCRVLAKESAPRRSP